LGFFLAVSACPRRPLRSALCLAIFFVFFGDESFILHASEFSVQFLYLAEVSTPGHGRELHAGGQQKAFENK
jgi:hypothetical protein